ncbi:hypothetical protein E0X81_13910 [Halomonas sp. GDM18]|nr:hypothetical protein E0X81_13910 [Halomonas sp. GDM18]
MGRFSELSISMYEGPNLTSIDKFICKECVIDSELAKVVSNGLSANYCSYCGVESDEYMAIGFDVIMLHIYNSILCYYADAQDIDVPWLEGGWWVENTEVHEVVNRFDPGWSDDFFSDIVSAIDPLTYWVEHTDGDWTVSNPSTSLLYGWERFKEQVLNKTRYLALSEPEDNFESKRPDHVPVSSMLDALGSVFKRYGNIVNIEAGNEFYRVRAMPKLIRMLGRRF